MKIYTYGIIDSNGKIDNSLRGLKGAGIYNIPYQDIGIVSSEFNGQIQDIKDHVLKHEEVIERMMEDFTVLPMKFLTFLDRKEDVLLMMKDYYNDFKENLCRLRNKVEFGIRVIWPGEVIRERIADTYNRNNHYLSASADSPEKSFVKKKFEKYKIDKELEEEADRCIAFVDGLFSRHAAEKKLEKLKTRNLLLSAFYLLEKENQGDFKERFERLRKGPSDLKYLFSGPWPPYNFIVLTKKTGRQNLNTFDKLLRR